MSPALLQAVAIPSQVPQIITESVVLGVMIGLGKVWDHRKGSRRDRLTTSALKSISEDVGEVKNEVRDLKAHVIGPDGQNGLRSDVRELRADVKGILERERDQIHGPYRKERS